MKKLTKSEIACNVTLILALVFTAIHILVLTLNLFAVTKFTFPKNFNYIVAYVLTIVCLSLYIFGFFIARLKRMSFPTWLRIFFYVAFFLFTNVYYILGLFDNIIAAIAFYAYLGFLVSVVSVSVFYNTQKDDKNRLKSSNKFISVSVLMYSVALSTFVQLAISIIKVIFFNKAATSTLVYFVAAASSMIVVSVALAIAYYISLRNKKIFINSCLVKFKRKTVSAKASKES